jgi:hypothetical protein
MKTRSADRARGAFRAAFIALLVVTVPTITAADGAMPIRVRATVEPNLKDPTATGPTPLSVLGIKWDANTRSDIEKKVAETFAAQLQELFKHWDFAAEAPGPYATLHLRLVEFAGTPKNIEFQLKRSLKEDESDAQEMWHTTWLRPGDVQLRKVPTGTEAPGVIAAALRLIEAREEQIIRDWIAHVPLAKGGRWIDPVPPEVNALRLVLALPDERFDPLRLSILSVSGQPPDGAGGEIQMRMKGIAMTERFELRPGQVIPALVVSPEGAEWSGRTVQSARALQIGWIFLEEFKEPLNDGFQPIPAPPPQ